MRINWSFLFKRFRTQKNLEDKNTTAQENLLSNSEKVNYELRTANCELTLRPADRSVTPLHPTAHKGRRARHKILPAWAQRLEFIARHFIVRLLQVGALLIVIGIPFLLLIARIHGLGDGVRKRFENALSGQFYEVKIHRLFFSISEGLIAEDLRLLEQTHSHRLLVHANRVALSPKLSYLARGILDIDSFQLRHTTIDIPLSNTEEPRLRLTHVEAKIISSPGQLNLSYASFNLCGINVRVHGSFLNPKTFSPAPVSSEGPGKIAQTIELFQKKLGEIQWEGTPPLLEMEVNGDLNHTESLHADAITFRSGPFSYQGWQMKSVMADFEYANFIIKLSQFSLEDKSGELHASGTTDLQKKQASVDFSGSCDLAALGSIVLNQGKNSDWTMIDSPHIEGSVSVDWSSGTAVTRGEIHGEEGRFSYRGIMINKISGGCIFEGGRFLLRDLQVIGDPGWIYADFMMVHNDYRMRISGEIMPQLLIPAAQGKLKEFLSTTNFKDPAKLNFEAKGATRDPFSFDGFGNIILGRSSVRVAWLDSCTANLNLHDGALTFQNIVTKIGKEMGQGDCIYDFKNQEARFPKIVSNLDPVTIMMWIDPHIAASLKDYRFHQAPELQVSGLVGLRDPQKNNLKIDINAPKGLDYTLIQRDLSFDNVVGTVRIKKQDLFADIPHAKLFGGDVSINSTVSVVPGDGHYAAKVHLEGVDFKSVTKLYLDYDTSEGKLSADYDFTALGGDDYAMKGQGSLLIKDGNVLAMPVFGPLSILMNDIIPGLGYQAARRATADFTVQKGVITTKNLSIQSAEFSMIGFGDIYYLEDRMNMSVRLNVKGLPGLVFFPVSKLFEYVSDGSAKHPTWRPKFVTLGQ